MPSEHDREQDRQGHVQEAQGVSLNTLSVDVARLEVKIDNAIYEFRQHAKNRLLHFGTVAGASGPILVGVLELFRQFVV